MLWLTSNQQLHHKVAQPPLHRHSHRQMHTGASCIARSCSCKQGSLHPLCRSILSERALGNARTHADADLHGAVLTWWQRCGRECRRTVGPYEITYTSHATCNIRSADCRRWLACFEPLGQYLELAVESRILVCLQRAMDKRTVQKRCCHLAQRSLRWNSWKACRHALHSIARSRWRAKLEQLVVRRVGLCKCARGGGGAPERCPRILGQLAHVQPRSHVSDRRRRRRG